MKRTNLDMTLVKEPLTAFCFFKVLLFFLLIYPLTSTAEPLQPRGNFSVGTGFLVSADGYIVTAWHVIKNKSQIYVGPYDAKNWQKAKLIKSDDKTDLALLKIPPTGDRPLEIAEWEDIPIGLEVFCIGYPLPEILGLNRKITQGLLSGDKNENTGRGLFQFSAGIQKGSSGGPVLSPDGLVIGVVQKKLDALKMVERSKDLPDNINYAIKSTTLIKFLESAKVTPNVKKINIAINMRSYEIYRQGRGAVIAILAKEDSEMFLDSNQPGSNE